MKVLFFGLGSIGLKHANLINLHFPEHELIAFRSGYSFSRVPPFIKEIFSWREVDQIRPDVAFICNPTYLHVSTGTNCINYGMALFIEKPLGVSSDLENDQLDTLLKMVKQNNAVAYVAYPFRHHTGLKKLRKRTSGSPWGAAVCSTDFRTWGKSSYSFDSLKGGGVLSELSHEIDLVEFLFGKDYHLQIHSIESDIGIDIKATLEARYIAAHVDILLDMVSPYDNYRAIQYYSQGRIKTMEYTANDAMYVAQLRYFFNNIHNPELENNVFDAAKLFEKIVVCRGAR